MNEELYAYYGEELEFFKQLSGEFAANYPKVAGRLQLDEVRGSTDPHVERLIQGFALLTARVRHKIDDQFPEVVESLLDSLYPHYLRPVPPMAIAQFQFDPDQAGTAVPTTVPSGALVHSKPLDGVECTFRTCYPATVWPLAVSGAALASLGRTPVDNAPPDAAFVLRIQIQGIKNLDLGQLRIPSLRFFLNGDGTPHYLLYELLFAHCLQVQVRPRQPGIASKILVLEPEAIQPVGFNPEEGMLPYSDRSFPGYRLLQEYFQFPQKSLFFDLTGLDALPTDERGSAFEVLIFFRDSALREQLPAISQAVRADTFQLGCAPIINLFDRPAETIRLTHTVTEYPVVADRHQLNTMEVYSVDEVSSSTPLAKERQVYQPFYSFRHGLEDQTRCFWHAHRRPSNRKGDNGTDVFLTLVDLDFKPQQPPVEMLRIKVTCTNRDFVSRYSWRKEWGEIAGEGLPLVQARCIVPPTSTVRAPMKGALQWRLISHLSLNHLSIVQGGGREALQEILRLYVFNNDEDTRKRISGITGVKGQGSATRVVFESGVALCRGLDVEIEFDETQFGGSGAFLLAAVLERFVGLYSALNSYTRLTARSRQRGVLKRWRPRVGQQQLL